MKTTFEIRIGDLQLENAQEESVFAYIVRFYKRHDKTEYAISIAYWAWEEDNKYNLIFIGDRPFKTNMKIFMKLAKIGNTLLKTLKKVK
jgi:hypothetical protein